MMETLLTIVALIAIAVVAFRWGARFERVRSERIYLKAEDSWRSGRVPEWPREWCD